MSSATLATTAPFGSGCDRADPFAVRVDFADLRPRLDVPPDQAAVVSAGDEGPARQREPGHVAGMSTQLFRRGLGFFDIDLVHGEVGAAAKELARSGLRATANTISLREILFEDLDLFRIRPAGSCQHLADRFGSDVGQGDRTRPEHVLFLVVDAERLVDRGEQLGGTDLPVDDERPLASVLP